MCTCVQGPDIAIHHDPDTLSRMNEWSAVRCLRLLCNLAYCQREFYLSSYVVCKTVFADLHFMVQLHSGQSQQADVDILGLLHLQHVLVAL